MQIKMQTAQKALILGGGPTGLFAALKLLEGVPNSQVTIFEKREKINRPQVINAAFEAVSTLPEDIKARLWPDPEIRENIFGDHKKFDPGFWPYTECKHLTLFQIGEFQLAIKEHLENVYADRFFFKVREHFSIDELQELIPDFDLVLVTTGNCPLATELREVLTIHDHYIEEKSEIDKRALNLIYDSDKPEPYERNGELISKSVFGACGITYSHANDRSNHVQIYTFPFGKLRDIFEVMPESMKKIAVFPDSKLTFDGKLSDGSELNEEEKKWFETYHEAVMEFIDRFNISHPSHDKIRVFSAERMEYHYKKAGAKYLDIPVMFLGDACGATDYKLGLGLGRALLMALNLTSAIAKHKSFSFDGIVNVHNSYWQNVIDTEFNQRNHKLTGTPEMTFKYFMKGRKVEGTIIDCKHRDEFLSEVRKVEQMKLSTSMCKEMAASENIAVRYAGA